MLVKCKGCGKKNERDISFKVVVKGKNHYYCNEGEYNKIQIEKESRVKILGLIQEIIGRTTNTVLFKELKVIADIHGYYRILNYIEHNKAVLIKNTNKHFNSEYSKIRYFCAILKNNISDYKIEKEIIENDKGITEFISVKYKSRKKKKSLNDYLNEYFEEE